MANEFGLQRHIPEEVALEVRRRSKFGCVICRCAIYQYEHIAPEFSQARSHDAANICLLCGGCHDRVTRGRISKETVKAKYKETQESENIRRPFEELDLSANQISIVMGTARFVSPLHLLRINGVNILSITPAKDGASFPTLNGIFCDRTGNEVFRIVNSVWEGPTDAWDVRVVGCDVVIKTEGGRIALALTITPPNEIKVAKLDMYLNNCHLLCGQDGILVGRVYGGREVYVGIGSFSCHHSEVGVDVDSRADTAPRLDGAHIVGGKGIELVGAGIHIGVNSAAVTISDLKVWTT